MVNEKGGKDFLRGGLGPDSFMFRISPGDDAVAGFNGTEGNVLWFQGLGLNAADEALAAAFQDGTDTEIDPGAEGSVRLPGVDMALLVEDDFRFN